MKKNSFLLLEILIALLIISSCLPLCLRSFYCQYHTFKEWQHEERIQQKVDEIFLEFKSELDFDTVKAQLNHKTKITYPTAYFWDPKTEKKPIFVEIQIEKSKSCALLLCLSIEAPQQQLSYSRKFSQIFCLKK